MPGASLPTEPKRAAGWTVSAGLDFIGSGRLVLTTGEVSVRP